jgi:poly-gamma-glutamate synthesis protein (capsule biosynthesis protein)
MESFARDCIEVGADVVVSHGPHVVRGIEIHDGSPIFYGLGDFIVQELLLDRLSAEVYDRHDIDRDATPADVFDAIEGQYLLTRAFWETILPVCEYDDGELAGIEIYPLDLGYNRPRPQSGIPRPADNETAQRILRKLDDCCESYGVGVLIEDGHGRINVS